MHHDYVNEQEMTSGVREGSVEALEVFIERFHEPLFRYLWHASGSKEDAEDLAVQALLRARTSIQGYRGDGTLRGWMFRVAYRELLQFRRREAIFRLITPKREDKSEPPNEDMVVISEALRRLPVAARSAFLMTEVEGLTISEAAAALGVSDGTVKSRCHSARQRLRKLLGPTYGECNAEPATD